MEWLIKARQKVKYEGKYNFHLLLNTEYVDSSSTISITCFTDKNKRAAVPCNYIWFIIKNGLPQEVSDFKGCTFICDTSYIGYYIQAHSNDIDYSGKAIITFGPVQLDVSLKTGILSALSKGILQLPIYFLGTNQQQKEGTLQLEDARIKLTHNFSEINYTFDYSIFEPQIIPHSRQINRATIVFNEKYETQMRKFQHKLFTKNDLTTSKSVSKINLIKSKNISNTAPKLQIKFTSRSSRDKFFFSFKAFIAKKQLRNSAIIRKIQSINFQKDEDFNTILEIDNLKNDLVRYDRLYKQALAQKKKIADDNCRLERQIEKFAKSTQLSMNVNYSATTRRQDPLIKTKHQISRYRKFQQEFEESKSRKNSVIEHKFMPSPYSNRKEEDCQSLVGLLADLSQFDPQKKIQKLQQQKKILQIKLERSFEQILNLQNKLTKPNMPSSAINFTYKPQNSNQIQKQNTDKIILQNQQLRRINLQLQAQLKKNSEKIQLEGKYKSETRLQSHLSKIRQQNRTTDMLIEQQKSSKLSKQIISLKSQLVNKQSQLQKVLEKCLILERKLKQSQMQIQMYRKNQDVLNRSQHMSLQMQNYNEQQIKMLKQHNEFLVEENQRLVKACQKYMIDAKQNNKLRHEIIQLKQKINHLMTNPQTNSFL